jgi:lysophospholipase
MQLEPHCTVLLGHSMGGLVAVRAVQSKRVDPFAMVISSPLLGLRVHINPIVVMVGQLALPLIPTLRFSNRIDPANMTHDDHFAEIRRNDKLIVKTVTASWFFAMRAAVDAAQQDAAKVNLPVLALQGSLDETTDPDAMARWWERIRSRDKGLIVLEGHFHELFFEPDWRGTTDQMLEWMEQMVRMRPAERCQSAR